MNGRLVNPINPETDGADKVAAIGEKIGRLTAKVQEKAEKIQAPSDPAAKVTQIAHKAGTIAGHAVGETVSAAVGLVGGLGLGFVRGVKDTAAKYAARAKKE